MATVPEIRAALASGPMTLSEIADKLGAEGRDRKTVYVAVTQMVSKSRGVERMDDGKITLIPGWKPARGPGAGGPKLAKAPKGKAPARKRSDAPDPTPTVEIQAPPVPHPEPEGPKMQTVTLTRRHVRLLVAAVMAWGDDLGAELKQAVVTATVLSA